jgi:anaerobic magnesium-protoporphyrin IX monomethyl ester cyclase
MRIYLLNPPFRPNYVRCGRWQGAVARGGGLDYPKWLAYATGVAEQSFKDVRLVDAPAWKWDKEKVLEDIVKYKPDMIVLDSNFSSLGNDIRFSNAIKGRLEGVTTVSVGPPACQYPEKILEKGMDIVARYEYDFTIKDIAEALEAGEKLGAVKGVSFKEKGKIVHNPDREFTTSEELDQIPFVSKVYKEHLNVKDYFLSQSLYPEVQIFTGRGCPHQCAFCAWPVTLMGRKYRSRSVDNIVDEFEYIDGELPEVKEVFIEDDTFTIDKKLVNGVCAELKKRKLDMTWACNARATLDYETMKAMKKAGCRLLIVGFESGSEEMLKRIKKGVGKDQMRSFTKDAKKARLLVHGDFIIGLPGETKETAEQTLAFVKELKPNIMQMAIATPLPGTEFHRWAKEKGHILVDDLEDSLDEGGFQKCIISYPDFSKEDIQHYVDRALKEYYLSPSFIPIALDNVLRKNGLHEFNGMLKSARVFVKYIRRKKSK